MRARILELVLFVALKILVIPSAISDSNISDFDVGCDIDTTTSTFNITSSKLISWYQKGLRECNQYLASLPQPGGNRRGKGNSLLLFSTGILLWPFGPKTNCPTHSHCWFGILSCGTFKEKEVLSTYQNGLQKIKPSMTFEENIKFKERRYIPKFTPKYYQPEITSLKKWSIQSINFYMRVVGTESVSPSTRYVTLPGGDDDVLLADYSLTIPGDYHLEVTLQDFYPGMLFEWKRENAAYRFDAVNGVYLGFRGYRSCDACPKIQCNNTYFSCCGCHSESSLVGGPFPIASEYRGHACKEKGSAPFAHYPPRSASESEWAAPVPLPFCQNGDGRGRWIRVPNDVARGCKADAFHALLSGSTGHGEKYTMAHRQYQRHVDSLDAGAILRGVTEGWRNDSLLLHDRLHRWELSR
jgi:hypothetical protein